MHYLKERVVEKILKTPLLQLGTREMAVKKTALHYLKE
jgi:hypothetical protein